jgi:dihydroflavonol-4-reductase
MLRALVTGGTGFIGSHVVRRLLKEKIRVRCLIRATSNRSNLNGLEVEYVIGDLRDPESLRLALRDCDLLFHVAADYRIWSKNPAELQATNVEGTRSLLQAAGDAKIQKIIYTSSVAAVGRPVAHGKPGIGNETLDPTPSQLTGAYKRTKFESDRLARDFAKQGLPVVIVNPSAPIGSHDIKPTPTGRILVDFLNGKLPAYIETGMNFVDVEDVAAGHWLAVEKGKVGERYILGHENLTLKDFLSLAGKVAKRPAPRFRIPYTLAWLAGAVSTGISSMTGREPRIPLDGVRMAHTPMYYDARKAVRDLGLPQTSIETALWKAVAWFRMNGYVKS